MLEKVIEQINERNAEAMRQAEQHLDQLTKPPGSLGKLELLTIQLAGITGDNQTTFSDKRIVLMAADHGVAKEGVSAFPQEVTEQMVYNFLRGGAAINVIAKQTGAQVVCVDIGVAADFGDTAGLVHKKVAYGSNNMRREPALSREQARQALLVGIELAFELIADGADLLATGEMGIANTTTSSAVLVALTGAPVMETVGQGTGVTTEGIAHKARVIEESIALHQPNPQDVYDTLHKVGGLELCGLAGLILGAASKSVPIVIDGFISTVAALCAARICPNTKQYMIASHRSAEPGHDLALSELGLSPIIDGQMRLGEGTGAALLFPMIDSIQAIMREMATFASAGVSGKEATSDG
ncbi:nicotinate-nucleotide--dimethylbenzimidazole phosphoribosyltransferase [Ammoniphilus oxalaticus]|uniref:Nicotinate-nucleotide--dimethylbenzimidazole phosphoribosyltransferase n=1 Tax=Ammoniphilus oxalaticus TaxID=66863 RepID=A0A419SLI7_9BACL|nr:nicotinate-nucleotide--dimethylbenzimidazole phosphoribosyltransferase [Ammoniphilus oxalaticus]RKD24939.1 nicotinate-nucleotide--dimethylbenzimidazole phosphoribosyltransferase [Ammoniphilus oxalaticus]